MVICTPMVIPHFSYIITFLAVINAQEFQSRFQSHQNWKLLDRGDDCGQSFSNKIIGGYKAKLGQFPWMARIVYTGPYQVDRYKCGGSIISDRYVLTAAHCGAAFIGLPMSHVLLGELDMEDDPDCEDGVCAPPVLDVPVEEHTCYPNFEGKNYSNDICLVRLARPVKFNDYISPICLPTYDVFKKKNFEGTTMEVAGWGLTDFFVRDLSSNLLFLKVTVTSFERCKLFYKKHNRTLNRKQICAGGEIGKDSCAGDSGGPLMRPFSIRGHPRYFLIGIVSYGHILCSATELPGIYTVVSEYMEWILNNIKK